MQVRWKTLMARTAVWLAAEICLGYLGLDELCDYSEFLDGRNIVVLIAQPA